jgi:hypothetical protein
MPDFHHPAPIKKYPQFATIRIIFQSLLPSVRLLLNHPSGQAALEISAKKCQPNLWEATHVSRLLTTINVVFFWVNIKHHSTTIFIIQFVINLHKKMANNKQTGLIL